MNEPERVWGRGVLDYLLAHPRVAWVARWVAAELCAVPLYVMVTAVLRWLLGHDGAAAVAAGAAAAIGWLWFRGGLAARQARQATGLGGRGVQWLAAALAAGGCLLWLVPHLTTGGFGMWCLAWLGAAVALGAVSTLALTGRRTRIAAALTVLTLAGSWMPLHRLILHAADAAALRSMGSPPRRLLVLVDWPGLDPNGIQYRSGTLTLEYGDGSMLGGAFTTLRVRATGTESPCAFLLQATVTDPDLTYSRCVADGEGLWASAGAGKGCAVVEQHDGLLLLATDDLCQSDLAAVLGTAHEVSDTALPSLQR